MEPVYIVGGHVNYYSYCRRFSKLKVEIPYGLAIPFPDWCSKDDKSAHIRGTYTSMNVAGVFTFFQNVEPA